MGEKVAVDDGKASQISCSVCWDPVTDNGERSWAKLQCGHQFHLDVISPHPVTDNGERSWAKLQCGHQFHLDCIGSAFNFKGVMQCPNCRKVEKGQWLYASPSRSFPDVSMDEDDYYDISYSEMTFGVHWCPFNGLLRMPSSFDEGDYSTASYHDLLAQQTMYEPLATSSSASNPCPYVAYMGPNHPSSSSSFGNVQNSGSSYNSLWNRETPPTLREIQRRNWEQQFLPLPSSNLRGGSSAGGAGTDQPSVSSMGYRLARANSDVGRSGTFNQLFPTGHSSVPRTGSSTTSSRVPTHPGSVARTRDRVQALQAYFQPPTNSPPVRTPVIPSSRRYNTHREYPQAVSSSNLTEGFYNYPPASSNGQNSLDEDALAWRRFEEMERDYREDLTFLRQVGRESIWAPSHDWRLRQTRSQNR